MVSKEAQKSIERFKRFSNLVSSLYRSPNEITKWRIFLFRWLINLQGTLSPKIKNTNKEVIYLDGIRTLKVSTPNSNSERIILYFHGGGYAMGSPESHYGLISYLADITKTTIFVPDYRLGPEHKYPSQLEDGMKSYEFLINNLGYEPNQIALSGDSAGGNLALITLLNLKKENKPLPNSLALLSPWADPAGKGETYNLEMADRDILLGPMMKKIWNSDDELYNFYLKDEDVDMDNELIFPLKGDYTNCPPIMIQVGTEELLLSDSQTLKKILERDNCQHEYYEWEGMYHVFHIDVTMPETIKAFNQISNFLNKNLRVLT